MKIQNLSYETWIKNHEPNHADKWLRELYPYQVFSKIDFDISLIDSQQNINFNGVKYYAQVSKIELQNNNRYRATFNLSSESHSQYLSWHNRKWDSTFQIIYTSDCKFVTIFSKKEDPSKDLIVRYMKGNFDKIVENRSIPISELLITTLILEISELAYPGGKHRFNFPILSEGILNHPEHPHFKSTFKEFAPLYSIDRGNWICFSFNEEKAHRIAFYLANQCQKLTVVFCNPTYTPHHRCNYESVEVCSLYQYTDKISNFIRLKFERQIRFLQSHLNRQVLFNISELELEIKNPKLHQYEIKKPDLLEALSVIKIIPSDKFDIFYSLAAMNLINAFLTQNTKAEHLKTKELRTFKRMYFFKNHLADLLTALILRKELSIALYINKDAVIVEIFDFQFSFHSVPSNEVLKEYEATESNREIIWRGIRLQPISPLIFYYSQALRYQKPPG